MDHLFIDNHPFFYTTKTETGIVNAIAALALENKQLRIDLDLLAAKLGGYLVTVPPTPPSRVFKLLDKPPYTT